MNINELNTFNLADAVKFHHRLNPRLWGSDEHLLPEVREKLLAIAADFQEFLGVDDLKVQDITISGSNAAYSYTANSDIDLHLVVEMPDDPVYQELFNAKKYQYNDEHDIRIGGVPVELYVQPADQKHVSQGIYSIKNQDWNQVPQRRRARIDDSCVQNKTADLDARIHAAVESGDADAINRLWDRIKDMRKTGLEKNGEFGCENITFKLLRNMGCIGRLKDAKTAIRDRELSLEQSNKPRKRMNYGMRDYWYPGTAYAGQDHPAGTESEQVDEAVGGPRIVVVGDSIALGTAQAAGLPYEAKVGRSTRQILDAAAANPQVQGADLAIVSAGTNDYPIRNGGVNPNPRATINNISRIRDVLGAKQYTWILPFNRSAAQDVMSAIGGDAYVDLVDVSTPDKEGLHPTNYKAVAKAALSKFAKPGIMESVDPDQLKKILHRFYRSCVSKLELENPPRLRLETTPDWSRENGSFGQYDPETNTLILATAGRHVLDILRTMAHEMTHRQQDEKSPLPADAGATGSPYEDQANAMAGRIMRDWAEEQPEMFDGVTLEESAHDYLSVPPVLYHATYRPLLRSIKRGGLGGPGSEKKKWEDSIHGAVYLALDPHVAESYAETSDSVPDEWLDEIVILQISTDGLNPSKFMLDRNVRDNAGDTVEYHGVIPLSNISLLKKNMSEASGYIPTRKQAKDPRFVMALTRDVQPGAVGKEANKLGLQTDSQGHPALLTAGLQKLLREFKEQDLFEINMGGKNLRKEAAKTGALAGMEFEMIVPNTQSEDEGGDLEPDYDSDERASSPRDIRDFFYDGDYNTRRSVDGLIDSMMNDYSEWQSEEFGTRWDSDSEQMIYDYIKENMDDDDVRGMLGLESEDPISREEYQLAADKITAEQIEPWYEDAQENARDEFFDEDLFEEWLSEAELAYMSDIERRYSGDINWPHYRSVSNRDEGASVQETAESFSAAVGRPARASDSYHAYGQERPAPGKNFYVVEPDGSLEPDDPDDAGLEFVSPPLPIDEIMSDLNKVKKWADLNGCYTNSSTGLHINISVPNYDLNKLDFVKLALLMGDEYVLEQFGRVSNTYARSAMKKVRDHVQNRPYEAKYLLDKMKGHMGELASKAIHSGITDKYTSINTKNGHVEFRSPGGDWLGDNFSMIENTLLRFTVALSAAMDPRAYRKEYLKKLYKTLAPKDEKDPLSIFAKYAAGELPAAALKSFVRQAQADRKAKKSGEDIVNSHRWRVSLKPELGGGVVEVMATDPIDAKKQAIRQQPNWRFVDNDAMTIERLDEPAAGASTTGPHPQGRGRPNDPNGRYAIVRRDDPRNYRGQWGSEPPDYLFRFSLPDGFTQAQMRAVMSAWAARENTYAGDYMMVDTTQFAAPAAPEPGSVRWNIINRNNETVHTFWNRNVQADANAAAQQWLIAHDDLPSVDMQGPFDVIPAAGSQVAFIPGSTLDLQRQRQAASQTPTPVAGVQDIEPDVEQYTSQPAQTQWEVYDRSTDRPVFRMYAADQAEAWRKGQEWVANYARMTPDQPIYGIDYSVRQSTAPVTEAFNHPYQLQWEEGEFGDYDAYTQLPDGSNLSIMFNREGDDSFTVEFWRRNSQEVTGEGDAQRIFATVLNAIQTFLATKEQPRFLSFTGEKGEEAQGKDSRVNLYSRMVQRYAASWGYQLKNVHDRGDAVTFDLVKIKQDVTEGRDNDNPVAQKIFFARSDKAPDGWSYDHVGFITQDGRQIQMSGHKGNEVYVTNTVTDDPEFPKQKIKIVSLSKPVSVPTTNAVGAENCGTFVAKVLQANGIKGITTQKIYSVFKQPHKQDVSESQEITKLDKLDSVLEKCIEMIHRGHESDPERYGRVAACLIDNKNNHTYAINMPGPDGTRRHAERMAIDRHLKNHGRIGPNAIMVTTLSPCVDHMDERYGESCTDLLSDYGIEKCYAGWQDPTQHPAEDYPFNLKITDNADIFNTCRDIAASFLPQAMAEAYTGPPMKFLRPGELSGSYTPQQMQSMGFKQSANGAWYIPMNMWQRLVSGGQIKENFADGRNPQTVTRIDSREIKDFGSNLKNYKHTDDWSQSGLDTGDDSYWKNKNLKTNTTKGLFAGDPRRTALYATGNAHETRYVEFTQNGQPIVYFDQKDLPAMRSRKTYLTVFDASNFRQLPTGEWFSENPGKPIKQMPIGDPFKYIASQGWIVRVTDDLDKVFKRVKNMHKAGKIAQYGAEGMNESKQGVAENFADGRNPEDKGDAKRHGINTRASVSSLRKTAKQGGRKGQLAHWLANMKAGRAKAKRKTNEDSEFVDTISPGLVADWDDQAGQIRYTKNNVVIPYGTAEYNAARAQHVEYRKNLKYNKLKQTTDPIYNQIRGAFEKEQQSPTKPGAAISVPQELFPQDTIKPPVKYDDPTDDDFMAEDHESIVEDTVATINLGGIIVNLDDHALDRQQQRGIDDKSFDSAIRKLKLPRVIKQMSQLEVGNRFYVLDHTTNVSLGMRKIGDVKYVLKTVYVGRPADYNIAEIITV